jgi:hypothetical protein
MHRDMSTPPKGEKVRQAIRWVSDRIREGPAEPFVVLAEQAAMRFDLSPRESEELLQFYRDAAREGR